MRIFKTVVILFCFLTIFIGANSVYAASEQENKERLKYLAEQALQDLNENNYTEFTKLFNQTKYRCSLAGINQTLNLNSFAELRAEVQKCSGFAKNISVLAEGHSLIKDEKIQIDYLAKSLDGKWMARIYVLGAVEQDKVRLICFAPYFFQTQQIDRLNEALIALLTTVESKDYLAFSKEMSSELKKEYSEEKFTGFADGIKADMGSFVRIENRFFRKEKNGDILISPNVFYEQDSKEKKINMDFAGSFSTEKALITQFNPEYISSILQNKVDVLTEKMCQAFFNEGNYEDFTACFTKTMRSIITPQKFDELRHNEIYQIDKKKYLGRTYNGRMQVELLKTENDNMIKTGRVNRYFYTISLDDGSQMQLTIMDNGDESNLLLNEFRFVTIKKIGNIYNENM